MSSKRLAAGLAHDKAKKDGKTSTSADVASPTSTKTATSTKTSTEADTQGNVTVTGGAGAGATTVVIVKSEDEISGIIKAVDPHADTKTKKKSRLSKLYK